MSIDKLIQINQWYICYHTTNTDIMFNLLSYTVPHQNVVQINCTQIDC